MRIGGENRIQMIILGVLLVVAAIALPSVFRKSPQTTAAQSAAPAASNKKTAVPAARTGKKPPPRPQLLAQTLDPSLRFDLLSDTENQRYEGSKRNIFSPHEEVKIETVHDNGLKTPLPPQP